MKNKMFKTALAIIPSMLLMSQVNAAGMPMQDWPVYDSAVSAKIQGLTDALLKHDNKIAQINNKAQTDLANNTTNTLSTNMTNISVMQDQRKAIQNSVPTLEKCIDVTNSMSMGLMANKQNALSKSLTEMVAPSKENLNGANLYSMVQSTGNLGTCTADEIKAKINGCGDKKITYLSGADTNIDVIRKNLATGSKSITDEQQIKVLNQFIKNFLYGSAPEKLTSGDYAKSTTYQAKYKEWHARISPLQTGIIYEAQRNIGMDINASPTLQSFWLNPDNVAKYKQLNGGAAPPSKPSFAETIQFMVMQDIFAGDNSATSSSKMNEIDVLKNIDKKLAINNYLVHQNLELGFIQKNILMTIAMNGLSGLDVKTINQFAPAGK